MSSSNDEDSDGEWPLSLDKPSVPAKDVDGSDSDSGEPQLSSQDEPSLDHSDSHKLKPIARGVEEFTREKLEAPSPPPTPNPSSYTLSDELLDLEGQVIYKRFSCWIVKHACGTRLTKFRRGGVQPSEAEAMRFVSEHITIPVPRVYDVGKEHITMEFVEGKTLAKAWEDILSAEDRTRVVHQFVGSPTATYPRLLS
ncbi:hypothetical protein VTI28DRAFT_858 [Corynascus sepedonium]